MYLTRSMLAQWQLSEAAIDAVLQAHQASMDRMRGEWEKELTEAQKLKETAAEYGKLKEEIAKLQQESERADRAETALQEYREQQESGMRKRLRDELMSAALTRAGVSEKILPLLMTVLDAESVQITDGGLENEAEMIEGVRKRWPECFTESIPEPAAGAHTGFGGMQLSAEELSRMTAEEINSQWESVQEALRGW